MAFGAGELACAQVGAAWAALEEFEKHIRTTKPLLSNEPIMKYQHYDWQRIFGLALATTNAAEAVLLRTAELYVEYAKARMEGTGQFRPAQPPAGHGHAPPTAPARRETRLRPVPRVDPGEHRGRGADAALLP